MYVRSRGKDKSIVGQIPGMRDAAPHRLRRLHATSARADLHTDAHPPTHLPAATREKRIPFPSKVHTNGICSTLTSCTLHPRPERDRGSVGPLQFISSPNAGVFAALYDDSIYRIELADIAAFCAPITGVSARAATRSGVIAFALLGPVNCKNQRNIRRIKRQLQCERRSDGVFRM